MKYLHFSLHDVAPFHLARLIKAEALFELWGVKKVSYLLVPNFHHKGSASENAEFLAFLRRPRAFEVEWLLHGEYHLESTEASQRIPNTETAWKRKHMTGGEGEFLALLGDEIRSSLLRGIQEYERCLGVKPVGFVPPAWLYNESLHPVLKELGFLISEDHFGIFDLQSQRQISAPVVTWATRTWLRRVGSLLVCPFLARMAKNKELLRVACHPWDFEFASTVENIHLVLRHSSARRVPLHLTEIIQSL